MQYIINTNKQDSKNGNNYEVHNVLACDHLPLEINRIKLNNFLGCREALQYAKQTYPSKSNQIDGCYYCCYPCHAE